MALRFKEGDRVHIIYGDYDPKEVFTVTHCFQGLGGYELTPIARSGVHMFSEKSVVAAADSNRNYGHLLSHEFPIEEVMP